MRALTLCLVIAMSCATAGPVTTRDEAAIISAVLADPFFSTAYGMQTHPVLLDVTALSLGPALSAGTPFVNPQTGQTFDIEQTLIDAIVAANKTPATIRGVTVPPPLRVAAAHKWRDQPSRVVTVSRPGFSKDGRRAIVAVTRANDAPCCPEGYTALLQRDDGGWRVMALGGFWVA